jgi:hypothetical protein
LVSSVNDYRFITFDGFKRTSCLSSDFSHTFIDRIVTNEVNSVCSGSDSNSDLIDSSKSDDSSSQNLDSKSDASNNPTSDNMLPEGKSGPTKFSGSKTGPVKSVSGYPNVIVRRYSVSTSRYKELVNKRSSDLSYKFNSHEINDVHSYFLSNNNKQIPVSNLNPKTNPSNKLEPKFVMDDIVISL